METRLEVDISRALQIEGWTNEAELKWLAERAQEIDPWSASKRGVIVEVGTYLGRSARAISDNKRDERGSPTMLYCVDPYVSFSDPMIVMEGDEGDRIYGQAIENVLVHLSKRDDYLISPDLGSTWFIREPSTRAALRFRDQTIDMVFIDGDHSYSSVLADITAWERTVKPGGLICGHDYNVHPGVKLAVDESFQFGRIKFPVGSIWAVRKPKH